jgi:hypothetical protein
MRTSKLRRHGLSALVLAASALPPLAAAHQERQSFFPQNRVQQPPAYRPLLPGPQSPRLVVCKAPGDEGVEPGQDSASRIATIKDTDLLKVNQQLLGECAFEHIQAAVDAVTERGTTIYVLPGIYLEQPSVRALEQNAGAGVPGDTAYCQAFLASGRGTLTYEDQFRCPHLLQLVGIFGDRNLADDDCGTDPNGTCTNPETVACNPATSACPYNDLQIEGTGERSADTVLRGGFYDRPGDPLIDGQHVMEVALRGDRTDGLYLRNFATEIFREFGPYVIEADGYVFDRMLGRFVDEYSYLSFATDHGLYVDSEGYGAGDSALYPGGQSDLYGTVGHAGVDQRTRFSTEIVNSSGHHAAGGYSGTGGDAVWVHNSRFYKNVVGLVTDSLFPNHPGMPQNHGRYEYNHIYNNNKEYVDFIEDDGPCGSANNPVPPRDSHRVPPEILAGTFDGLPPEAQEAVLDRMVVCPSIPAPKGTGFIIAGGNYDVAQGNEVFDNWSKGLMLLHVPAALRENTDPDKAFDTSHYVRYLENRFAEDALRAPARIEPNGVDFWFDDSGLGNCWARNSSAAGAVTEDTDNPTGLQSEADKNCLDALPPDPATQQANHNEARIAFLAPCAAWDPADPSTKAGCSFFDPLTAPAGRPSAPVVLASSPPAVAATLGQSARTGYFVLNNDSGRPQNLNSVTIAASGPVEYLTGLTVSVTVAAEGQIQNFEATVAGVSASNVLTFSSPVPVPAANYVMFDLDAASGLATAAQSGGGVALASAGSSLAFVMALFAGGPRKRRVALTVALALAAGSLLGSCGGSQPVGGGAISFQLTAMDVTDANGAVTYAGLPLGIGSITLH